MFRLAVPLLVSAVALNDDESCLMQGMKPKEQKEDKSKAIANLMQSAANMLKNGATEDVVLFAQETLKEIRDTVLPAIQDAHNTDQRLIDDTHALFANAVAELEANNRNVKSAYDQRKHLRDAHGSCRGQEETACGLKQTCDYELYALWNGFVQEEEILREHSRHIDGLFCPPGANGTTESFRAEAVTFFDPWLIQKPVVDTSEATYNNKRPECVNLYSVLDEKTAECDAIQTQLDAAACGYSNAVQHAKNTFAESWEWARSAYQNVADEVHCLEIDRWKEWRTLATVQCLLDKTAERNGRPCEEETNEAVEAISECERVPLSEDISHLMINFSEEPPFPAECESSSSSGFPAFWPYHGEQQAYTGRCVPVLPRAPCTQAYKDEEYEILWTPPQPEFHSENSHCNFRAECQDCSVEPEVPQCGVVYGSSRPQVALPTPEHECSLATRDHLAAGSFDPWQPSNRQVD